MDFNTSYNKIVTDENMMEMIQHGDRGYPFKLYYDDLALFDFHCVEWHWHVGFEFVLIETGTVTFGIGEKQVTLEKGHGVFINSKILHRYYSDGHAVVPNCVVDPDFLAAPESLIRNILKKKLSVIVFMNVLHHHLQPRLLRSRVFVFLRKIFFLCVQIYQMPQTLHEK